MRAAATDLRGPRIGGMRAELRLVADLVEIEGMRRSGDARWDSRFTLLCDSAARSGLPGVAQRLRLDGRFAR